MIVLFTDFGLAGPYIGQMKAVLARRAPGVPVIDLFADAPAFDPQLAAYLLAAYAPWFPAETVFLCVVDPGVGTDERLPLVVRAEGRWFVGPGNGLFEPLMRRSPQPPEVWRIAWQPPGLSASFHGRDLFAPVAAELAAGGATSCRLEAVDSVTGRRPEWPDDLARIVYIDHYGNAMTGLRASAVSADSVLTVAATSVAPARTFGEVPMGCTLWYENSTGLVEIAVNRGRAAETLGLRLGMTVDLS